MRYQQWRLMLLRSYHRSHLSYPSPSSHSQLISISIPSFLHFRSGIGAFQQSDQLRSLSSPVTSSAGLIKIVGQSFSSESAINEKPSAEATVIDIYSRLSGGDEIKKELESSNIVITQDLALKILRKLESNPDVAKRFFHSIEEAYPGELSSKSYNMMLRILGGNGLLDEFWGMVDVMKKKGLGYSANVRDRVGEKFQKDGLESDLARLKKLFASDCLDSPAEKVCHKVCKIVMKGEWGDDVEKQVRDLNVEFQSDLVKMIVESLDVEPRKALLFFRWIDESGLFKHDEKTYNALARVLGKEKFLDRFQNIVEEMRSAGYEVELETYVRVSARFCQTNLIKEAVDLFEIAMTGSSSNKPTPHCFCLLLKKIVTAKILDMDLFSRALNAYTKNGEILTNSFLKSVLKSLRSVDRVAHINEVLEAMKKGGGFVPNSDLQSMIASGLSRKGKKDEANELVEFMEASGNNLDDKAMASLVEGYCDSGELKEALECFEKMAGKTGVSYADNALEKLIFAYCNKNQARDAYKLLSAQVMQNQLKPRHSTYKILVRNLLTKKTAKDGGFEEALSLLPIMKDHGFPPFVDPFMNYFSRTGKSTEALGFLKAMTSKNFPSISMVMRLFETMLKSARHSEAQDVLSLCPNYTRNHPDVLELFNSMKLNESAVEKPLAVST